MTIVFDGYGGSPSTNDSEHRVRSLKAAPHIAISSEMPVFGNQAAFLANERNKKQFVSMLINHLTICKHKVLQSDNDADTLIVNTAL